MEEIKFYKAVGQNQKLIIDLLCWLIFDLIDHTIDHSVSANSICEEMLLSM